jgi:cytochrome P450
MTPFPSVAASNPEGHPLYRLLAPLEPLRVRIAAAASGFLLRNPSLGDGFGLSLSLWDLVAGEIVYGRHISSQATMWRARRRVLGDTFPSFRAVVQCGADDVEALIERTPPALRRTHAFVAQYAQPDLLSPSTFLFTEGATHDRHRAVLVGQVMARTMPGAEGDVDALLREWRAGGDFAPGAVEKVLTRAAHRLLLGMRLDEVATEAALTWQRTFFSPVMFAPAWMRRTLLAGAQRKLDAARATLEALYAKQPVVEEVSTRPDGLPPAELAAMLFEVMNLNAAAIQSIAVRVVRVLSERADLQATLRAEHRRLGLDAAAGLAGAKLAEAVQTEHFVLEVLRLYTRVTTVQWRSEVPFTVTIRGRPAEFPAGTLRCANLATANVDPDVFADPFEIRLDRDYGRFMNFNGVVSPRACPGRGFAVGLLVRFVVHALAEA